MKHSFSALTGATVSTEDSVIRSVSLIKKGDAKGHVEWSSGKQVIVDNETLSQIFSDCVAKGSVKVKADHGSGVFSTIGWVDNFSLTDSKVTADFHIYGTEPQRERILEIAEKNPEHMGISMEFEGNDITDEKFCYARCNNVIAAALVSDPAANVSLFSKPNNGGESEPENKTMATEDEQEKDPILTKLEEIESRLAKLEAAPDETEKEMGEDKPDGDKIPATSTEDQPADAEEKKEYSAKDLANVAEMAATKVIKQFASKLGTTKLSVSPAPTEQPKEKTYTEIVSEVSLKEFSGDKGKAEAHVLSCLGSNPEWKKAYTAHRQVSSGSKI